MPIVFRRRRGRSMGEFMMLNLMLRRLPGWINRLAGPAVVALAIVMIADLAWASSGGGHGGGGLPQLKPEYFPEQLFWLVISFVVLYIMNAGVGLPRVGEILEKREETIARDIHKAEELKEGAATYRTAVEQHLVKARAEANETIAGVVKEAEAKEAAQRAKLELEFATRLRRAEERVALAKKSAMRDVHAAAADIARAAVAKLGGVEIDDGVAASAVAVVVKERG
ncbi:F-type H+-transporting ATPase subunit b [Azospirillaceae bacterium]